MKMKMKILFLSWVLVFCTSGNLAEAYDSGILSAGSSHTCAIDHEGVKCWGENRYGQTDVPTLKNPSLVSAGYSHTCAIDDEGVTCWGNNEYGKTNVPPLKNPTSVSAGLYNTCALDDEGVKCWGLKTQVPFLKNPKLVSVGDDLTCAVDDEGVKCWENNGGRRRGPIDVPSLANVTSISTGIGHACAIDGEGVKCWGDNGSGESDVPPLKNPTSISARDHQTCAIDDDGVKCWGSIPKGHDIPPLRNPTSVSSGWSHNCALDDEGVKCWGWNRYGQTDVPSLIFFGFTRPEFLIDCLVHWSTPIRTSFFSSLAPFVKSNFKFTDTSTVPDRLVHGRYILTALLEASIVTGDSTFYIENIIPGYISRMKAINQQTGIQALSEVKDFTLTRLTALKIMQTSLSVMTEFLTAEDKAHIQDIIKLIGTAMTDVSNKQLITNALTAIDANQAIIDKLNHSSKTQFLVLTLKTAQQWLNIKIK